MDGTMEGTAAAAASNPCSQWQREGSGSIVTVAGVDKATDEGRGSGSHVE